MKTEAFCWWCQRQLYSKRGGGYSFALVADADGREHRVHKDCLRIQRKDMERAGCTFPQEVGRG